MELLAISELYIQDRYQPWNREMTILYAWISINTFNFLKTLLELITEGHLLQVHFPLFIFSVCEELLAFLIFRIHIFRSNFQKPSQSVLLFCNYSDLDLIHSVSLRVLEVKTDLFFFMLKHSIILEVTVELDSNCLVLPCMKYRSSISASFFLRRHFFVISLSTSKKWKLKVQALEIYHIYIYKRQNSILEDLLNN